MDNLQDLSIPLSAARILATWRQQGRRLDMADGQIESMIRRVSNWGRWGPDDELGTMNFVTPERRVTARELVRTGRVFSLAIPFDERGPQPPFERRLNPRHVMLVTGTDLRAGVQPNQVGGWGYADDMVTMALQAATQWDSLAHAFYDYRMYNDRDCLLVTAEGASKNSIAVLRDRVVGRGVLLDVARYKHLEALPLDYRITIEDLEGTLEAQQVRISSGDILLIRTGNLGRARAAGGWDRFTFDDEPGIGLETLPWFHEHEVAAAATDTWAFEVLPSGADIMLPVHAVAIVHMGLLIGEIFDLDELAADCAADGIYDFLFAAPPLPFTGAVGSPVNPLAVK
jgi:kynurenine formamidase